MNGFFVLKKARAAGIKTPVIVITALGELYDRIEGLDCGADDYMVKPFAYEELSARIRSLGRRSGKWEAQETLSYGDLSYDLEIRQLSGPVGSLMLSGREGRLAEIFRVDVAALHEIWMLCGIKEAETIRMEQLLDAARQCADSVIGAVYDGNPVMSLSTPRSLRDTERAMEEMLRQVLPEHPEAVLVRCSGLSNTTSCRKAYLLTLDNLEDAKFIYPHKRIFPAQF